jgi:hypothetical protein
VYACGNISIQPSATRLKRSDGYTDIEMELLDLDGSEHDIAASIKRILSCKVPKNFKIFRGENDELIKPIYKLTPFRI